MPSLENESSRTRDRFPVRESHHPCSRRHNKPGPRARPRHPILLLSNVHDPVTSIQNSYLTIANSFVKGDAGLGIRSGYGVRFQSTRFADETLIASHLQHCSYTEKSTVRLM